MGEMCWGVMLRVVECKCVSVCESVTSALYATFLFVAVRAVSVDCLS